MFICFGYCNCINKFAILVKQSALGGDQFRQISLRSGCRYRLARPVKIGPQQLVGNNYSNTVWAHA